MMRGRVPPSRIAWIAPAWVLLASAATVGAGTFTWNGTGGDAFWTTGANWDEGAPGSDLDGDFLVFGATGLGPQSPDIAGNVFTEIGGISFTGADDTYTITDTMGGGRLEFTDGAFITNDSLFDQTIEVDLRAIGDDFFITADTADLFITGDIDLSDTSGVLMTVDGASNTALSGIISGAGGALLKQGTGTLFLSGVNSYAGGTELAAGTIVLGDHDALGDGPLMVTGDSAIESDDNARLVRGLTDIIIDDLVTLTVQGGFDLDIRGDISGDGSLTIDMDADDDVVILNGMNTQNGDTSLVQGTLVLGTDQAIGNGELDIDGDSTIESDGDLRKITNRIRINTDNTLRISGEFNLRLFGRIVGTGSLTVDFDTDDDTLTLTGDNTYDGGTTLAKGTIILGQDNALGTGLFEATGKGTIQSDSDDRVIANDIDLLGGAALTFSGSNDLQLDGLISGAGRLIVDADDDVELLLTGLNTFTGVTDVDGGILNLADGASLGGALNVNDEGTLFGAGTVDGDLTLMDGGRFAPGFIDPDDPDDDSIDTFFVGGDYVQLPGSTLTIDLSFDGTTAESDLISISGLAFLGNSSTIAASVISDVYIPTDTAFKILEATGGITNNGVFVMTESATVTVELAVDPMFTNMTDTEFNLVLLRAADAYSNAANAGTNTRIARSLDEFITPANADPLGAAGDLLGRLDQLNATDYNRAVSELSPEPYNVVTVADLQTSRDYVTQQVAYLAAKRLGIETFGFAPQVAASLPGSLALSSDDPLLMSAMLAQMQDTTQPAQPSPGPQNRWGRYAKFQGIFIDQDTTATRTGFKGDSVGAQFGLDYSFSQDFLMGVSVGYLYTNSDFNSGLGKIDEHSIRSGPYLSYTNGDWFVDASASFAWHIYDGERNMPTISLTADSDYNGWDVTGYLGTGYRFEIDRNLYLTPMTSVIYNYFDFEGFTETGAGGANLVVGDRDAESLRSRVGATVSYRIPDLKWQPIPYAYVGWEHEYLNNDDDVAASFATGGSPFLIDVGNRDEDAVFLGFGFNMLIKQNVSAFFRFEHLMSDHSDASAAAGGLSVAF